MNTGTLAARVNAWADAFSRWMAQKPAGSFNRLVGLAVGAPALAVLGLASWLTPDEKGFGTHRQLGLGECTMLHLTGYPCPMCGMTTTFTLFAHFRPLDALLNQPFGVVLFGSTVVAAIIGLVDLVTGKGLWRTALGWIGDHEVKVASVLFFGMLGGWIYKVLLMHPTLLPG